MARIKDLISPKLNAFLDLIAWSELGRGLLDLSDDGYNILVGSTVQKPLLFTSYNGHPQQKIYIPRLGVYSTAAGRYQILKKTWGWIKTRVSKHVYSLDFGPECQDWAAIELIKYRQALELVEQNRIESAIEHCALEWASFPGGPYGQGNHTIDRLMERYEELSNGEM